MTRRRVDARGAPLLVTVLLAMICSAAVGCEPSDPTPVGRGARVFQRSCSGCHGADGRGVMRLGLSKPPRDLTNPEFHAQVSDEQLRRVIRVGKNQMPAFGGLMGDEDLSNVIAFIRTLPPGAKAPAASPPSTSPSSTSPPTAAPPSARVAPSERSNRDGVLQ
jgi:mono/diheme cytochrome c family protein